MEDSEKNRYIEFLLQQKEERDRTIAEKDAFIKNLQDTLDMLKSMHESDSKKIDEMLTKINQNQTRLNYVECSRYSIIINLVNLNVLYLKGPLGSAACLSKNLLGLYVRIGC